MVKRQVSATIDEKLLRKIERYKEKAYPGLSRSAVIEIILRNGLPPETELSIA